MLQNADDAGATEARFTLERDRLVFAHDGERHFSITDPANEREDSDNQSLGDINAITSIANSSKTGASIGKFGVGFKAVFQYTSTPCLYDPSFRFKIDRFIVPVELDDDYPGRKPDETLFVFPFDHHERSAAEAYADISGKLRNLSYPLLFLNNLKRIEFNLGGISGRYEKEIRETRVFDKTKAEYIILTQKVGNEQKNKNEFLWLFSREYEHGENNGVESNLTYSVGFFLNEEEQLIPVDKPAFCFFPTKETTKLKFIIHAPFLLTDNRGEILAGVSHNDNMIDVLAELAADAMEYLRDIGKEKSIRLIDDKIITIIPVDPADFSDPSDKNQVSFLPFYEKIQKKFKESELLPTKDGYIGRKNAYWASVLQLNNLFSNHQLGEIVDNPNACWVFVTLAREDVQKTNNKLRLYIDSLVRTNINEDIILGGRTRDFYVRDGVRQELESIKGITADFIEKQSIEWLHDLYKWIRETQRRRDVAVYKPIFIDQDGKAAAAFDRQKHLILFLPNPNMMGYRVINPELLKNEITRQFVEAIGLKQPSLKDYIYTTILPQYQDGEEIDTDPHFKLFFDYFCKCPNEEVDGFIKLIKPYEFLTSYSLDDDQVYRGAASSMYLPTPELKEYFKTKPDTDFISINEYKKLVGPANQEKLIQFLKALGINTEIRIILKDIDNTSRRNDLPKPDTTRNTPITYKENTIDGCKEIIDSIVLNKDIAKSEILWKALLRIIETRCKSENRSLDSFLQGTCYYTYYRRPQTRTFISSDVRFLKEKAWIMNADGAFVTASEVTAGTLSEKYDTKSEAAQHLLSFLKIRKDDDDSNLTDEQRKKIAFANKLKEYGIEDDDDLEDYREFKRQKEAKKHANESLNRSGQEDILDDNDDFFDDEADDGSPDTGDKASLNQATKSVLKDIVRMSKDKSSVFEKQEIDVDEDADEDEYMPSTVDYLKKIEREKEKSAASIERIAYLEKLQKKANEQQKYTFGWFRVLLEMEGINGGIDNANSREVSISFAKVEREAGTMRTLVLKHPSQYIPQFMEDLTDIPMVLHLGDQIKTVAIEVANIISYTLRVKMKNAEDIEGIDLDAVTSVTIDAKSPVFLVKTLREQFEDLQYDDDFNMQENLCENIEFVFGPPGTGKTTYLARNVLITMMKENNKCRVLVLTPTNKSADVLVRKIMEVSGNDMSYNDWLIRFGATGDEEIEKSPVYKDKTFDIRTLQKNVTVTTIARFPYDYFMPQGARLFLREIKWDFIVIDEASMIPIANIVFPLYKTTPEKFIIAGDPFQIEPITSVALWKNENIYTMVRLDSFDKHETVPHPYHVKHLTTQYRSLPDIGGIFSGFAYNNTLRHYRAGDSQRPLNLGDELKVNTLNIIKFPVSKYESIYRPKRLQHSSSYQVYSALFTFEYVCYLSRAISRHNPGERFKIGVIAPYRAQADMLDKLLASEQLPKEIDVQVGTIHSFQGDECDIIFAVFNTPPSISSLSEMFLNKKNIINVSISRARDYLFIVMPDDNTENISNLRLVKKVESLIKQTNAWTEFLSPALEKLMFGDAKYLENNAFSTSHQNVNVYGLPERIYEVRTEDAAIDVQIHKSINTSKVAQMIENIVDDNNINNNNCMNSNDLNEVVIPESLREDNYHSSY